MSEVAAKPMRESVEEIARQLLAALAGADSDNGRLHLVQMVLSGERLSERRKGWEMRGEADMLALADHYGFTSDEKRITTDVIRSLPFLVEIGPKSLQSNGYEPELSPEEIGLRKGWEMCREQLRFMVRIRSDIHPTITDKVFETIDTLQFPEDKA